MIKARWMMMTALFVSVSVVRAQGSDEVTALQKQLNELSAKIEQLEKGNSEKIAKLEAADAKNKIPGWVTDTKFKGDFRYRYENVQKDDVTDQDRQRVRVRVGAFGKVNDGIDYGVRVAAGGASATSANQDIDGGTKKSAQFDQYYVDLHPELLMGAHLVMGKMAQPWLDRTGMIWDSDLNPEGLALTYATANTNGVKLMANAGSFVIRENINEDLQLWAGQLAGEFKVGEATVRLGVSDFYYRNADELGVGLTTSGANTANTGFNLVEGFGTVSMIIGIPVALNGQYVVNTDAASDDDTAYLAGISVGKAKDKGTWEAGYNWRDTGNDAVPDGFNDSDFANGLAGSHGHSIWTKYQIAKNLQGGLTYLIAVDNKNKDINTFQADLNFKF